MRNAWCLMLLASCAADLSTPEVQQERQALELTDVGANPGNVRLFLFAPSRPQPGAGLVVALHGCAQTAADFQKVGWNTLAQANGFYVLYAQASASNGCFRWFDPGHSSRGEGETASIVAGVDVVLQRFGVDRRRVFVTGLSAGAAMSAALLASSPDVFSAGSIFAGLPAGCATTSTEALTCMQGVDLAPQAWAARVTSRWPLTPLNAPRVQVWTGAQDTTVSPSMARELVEQWTALHGLTGTEPQRETVRRLSSEVYGNNRVQAVTLSGFGHAVPVAVSQDCGALGPFVQEAGVCGALEAARFFGLIGAPAPVDVETLDAGSTEPDAGVDAGTPSVDAGIVTCKESIASPTWQVWLRHANVCGFFQTLVCANGSDELLGSTLSSVPVTAWSLGDGTWHAGPCP